MASSREDKNKNNNTYSRDTSIHEEFDFLDTQPLDISHSPSCDDESRYFEDTEPFDDCDGDNMEAEPMNLAGETQVLDFAGETQPLDDFDGAALVDDCTQLLNEEGDVGFESGGEGEVEGLDGTQVLEGGDDDADVSDGGDRQSAYNKQEEEHERFSDEKSFGNIDSIENELNNSGLKPPRFTYLRVESLRKAALAARNVASKKTSNGTSSDKGNSQSCQEHMVVKDNDESFPKSFPRCYGKVEEVNRECSGAKYSMEIEGQKNKNADKVASSAVRKLFNDALPIETNEPSLESNDFDGVDELPICHDGLSYVNSQEPGELSQLNALDFVDRFLHDNIMEFDQDTNRVKNTTRITTTTPLSANCAKNVEEKSKSVANGKGQQNLAKRVTDRGKDAKAAVFDWDDSREDEGGGDIYLRRKEDFFYCETRGSKSLPVSQKTKVCRPNNDKDAEEKLNIPSRKTRAVHSDSRLGRHNQRVWDNNVEEATRRITRNLAKELGEQLDANCSRGEMEPKANADVQETMDVGLDTQMAAEAMEALCGAETLANDTICNTRSSSKGQHNPVGSRDSSRQFDKKRKAEVKSDLQTSSLSKKCTEVGQCKKGNIVTRSKMTKLNAEAIQTSGANENGRRGVLSPMVDQRKSTGALKILDHGELKIHDSNDTVSGRSRVNEKHLQDEVYHCTPIARRTRQSLTVNQFSGRIGSLEKTNGTVLHADESLDPNSTPKASTAGISNEIEMDALDCPRRRRSLRIRKYSDHDKGSENLVDSSKSSVAPKGKSSAGNKQSSIHSRSPIDCNVIAEKDENLKSYGKNIAAVRLSSNNFEVTNSDESPKDCHKSSDLASATTQANCKTPMNDASPVCMGDDYYKQSCNGNLSRSCLHKVFHKELQRELRNLSPVSPELTTPSKDSRKRRDMTDVRILYSNHLNEDIIKHQKKILARLGVSVASSIADATHFIADQFVRTRNMLEAIAFGKPVVTHLWIESCGQASCFIDEKNYILRDAKKEKEFGFSMPVSLARASRHPLLEGRRVLITPNTKPSKEIISTLVRAVQGQVMERISRSVLKENKILDDLLILSCEEDHASCVPFLEKGVMVYSSELLLNGIVIQKLDYERHCLFAEQVKKTRSTVWLRKDDRTFLPVTKCT